MSSDDLLIALPAEAYTTLDASSYLDLTTPARLDGLVESCGTLTGEPQAVQPPPSPSTEPCPPSRPSFSVPFPPRHTQYNAQGVFQQSSNWRKPCCAPGQLISHSPYLATMVTPRQRYSPDSPAQCLRPRFQQTISSLWCPASYTSGAPGSQLSLPTQAIVQPLQPI